MRGRVAIVGFLALWIGLEAGYRIGINAEARTHRAYIDALNLTGQQGGK